MQDAVFAAYIEAMVEVSPQRVASDLGVSVRTVRTYVRQANASMTGFAHIDLARTSGYTLVVEDRARYDAWRAQAASTEGEGKIPQTPQERVRYLLNDLLMRNSWITLEEFSNILFVSRKALSNDLKQVERTLSEFGLTLEKRPHYGIRVSGPEMSRRLCLANLIWEDREAAQAISASPKDELRGGGGF